MTLLGTTLRLSESFLDELFDYHPNVLERVRDGFLLPMFRHEAETVITLANEVHNDRRFSLEAKDEAIIFLRKALNNMEAVFGESDDEYDEEDDDGASFHSHEEKENNEEEREKEEGACNNGESQADDNKDRISMLEREVEDLRERVDELEDFRQRMNDLSDSLARIAAIPSMTPRSSQAASQTPGQASPEPSNTDSPNKSRNSEDSVPSYEKHSQTALDASTATARPVSVLLPRQVSLATVSRKGTPSRSSSGSVMSKVTKVRPRRRKAGSHRSKASHGACSRRSKVSETSSAGISSVLAQPPSRASQPRRLSDRPPTRLSIARDLFEASNWILTSDSTSPVAEAHSDRFPSVRGKIRKSPKTRPFPPIPMQEEERPPTVMKLPPGTIPEERCTSWECKHNPPPSLAVPAPSSTRQRVLSWKARFTKERGDIRWARAESPPGSHSRDKRTRALVAKLEKLARY